ncbi:MAG: DNA alkylation repair protein [Acidobacteria bacterium]|nr:DNA alkylation repair protein [Acidobacteriota bacterium]MBI3663042.1 DNA alkylation repair protein [Acidobacteriota bacterium]
MRAKAWWEGYLKGAAKFRGVPMGVIRECLHTWWRTGGIGSLPVARQKAIVLALIRERYTEDKLAGILAFAEILLPHLGIGDLPAMSALYELGHIADWNVCDWFSVKVLGRMVEQTVNRKDMARSIAVWRDAPGLWQRRAACVAFVNLAKRGDKVLPGLSALVLRTCSVNVRSKERFLQTGVGWVLRELSLAERDAVVAFARTHAPQMSRECMRYVTEKMPEDLRRELIAAQGSSPPGNKRKHRTHRK